jgi:hypothetical protein
VVLAVSALLLTLEKIFAQSTNMHVLPMPMPLRIQIRTAYPTAQDLQLRFRTSKSVQLKNAGTDPNARIAQIDRQKFPEIACGAEGTMGAMETQYDASNPLPFGNVGTKRVLYDRRRRASG